MPAKRGRPKKPASEQVARSGKSVHVYIPADTWEAVEAWRARQQFEPTTKALIIHALNELVKKGRGK